MARLARQTSGRPASTDDVRAGRTAALARFQSASLVGRLRRLQALPFEDAQIHEATRCWLYGLHRAAVVLAAAALEKWMKRISGITRFETYEQFVNELVTRGRLLGPYDEWAKQVFKKRTGIVHHDHNPDSEEAEDVLTWVRGIVTSLHQLAQSAE